MPTRNVVLTDHQARLVEQLVASGRYQNASEVIRAGLRLLLRSEAEDAAKLEALRNAAAKGIQELDGGYYDEVQGGELMQYLDSLDKPPQSDR